MAAMVSGGRLARKWDKKVVRSNMAARESSSE